VEFEYLDRSGGRADVALYLNDKPQILIEAKPIQNEFKKEWPTKIFDYMSKTKIKYGIETNGKELTLYDDYRVKGNCKRGGKLFSIKSDDFITYGAVLWLVSKDMVEKGELDRFAAAFHRANDNFYKWRESRKKPRDANYNEYILRLEFAREFLKINMKNYS
jgi:predicted type IV restriction endonuclease